MRVFPCLIAAAVLMVAPWRELSAQDALARGREAFLKGDLAAAEAAFEDHLRRQPNSAEALSNLAAVNARRREFDKAIDLYRKALSANPRVVEIHFNLAVAQIAAGNPTEAAASLRAFLEARPAELRARQLLGLCLVESGDPRAGLPELEKVFAANPAEPSVLFSLAYAHLRSGNSERGAELLGKLPAADARFALLRGLLHYREGRFAEAREEFDRALAAQPNLPPALAAVGRLYLLENKDDQAIAYLEKAVALSPTDSESVYQLGVLFDRNGGTPKGKQYLNRAIQLRASYPDPHYQLARIEHRDGNLKAALRHIDVAANLIRDHEAVRLLRGRILQGLGDKAGAAREFAAVRRIKASVVERDRKRLENELTLDRPSTDPAQDPQPPNQTPRNNQ